MTLKVLIPQSIYITLKVLILQSTYHSRYWSQKVNQFGGTIFSRKSCFRNIKRWFCRGVGVLGKIKSTNIQCLVIFGEKISPIVCWTKSKGLFMYDFTSLVYHESLPWEFTMREFTMRVYHEQLYLERDLHMF